ncbi:MAG TPA: hypothetical protein VGL86_23620 [Polyangia bacterium]
MDLVDTAAVPSPPPRQVSRAREYLHAHAERVVSLAQLASRRARGPRFARPRRLGHGP